MAEYNGERSVVVVLEDEIDPGAVQFAKEMLPLTPEGKLLSRFDFSQLKDLPMQLKLDVGASAYWSEIASTQTLDNLLAQGHIDVLEYLERIPDGYITDRVGLIKAIQERRSAMPVDIGGGGSGGPVANEPAEEALARTGVRAKQRAAAVIHFLRFIVCLSFRGL